MVGRHVSLIVSLILLVTLSMVGFAGSNYDRARPVLADGLGLAGDVNCDDQTNSLDASLILQLGAVIVDSLSCEDSGDVNRDGALNALDATLILQFNAGLIGAFTVPRKCSEWPSEMSEMLQRLPIPDDVCLVRFLDPADIPGHNCSKAGACYVSATREVRYAFGAPVGGELASLTHEICHAHQHQVVIDDAGFPEPNNVLLWYETAEGRSFIEVTGWRLDGGNWAGKISEPGWSGYTNPLEDFSQVCAFWFDGLYDIVADYEQDYLENFVPIRYEWAKTWLPE